MRGHYGTPLLGFAPVIVPGGHHRAIYDDYTPYGHVRPVSEMSWGDVATVGLLVAIGGLVVYGAKRAGDYAKDRYEKRLGGEGTLPKARVLNGVHK
jgi:hypothetical protein